MYYSDSKEQAIKYARSALDLMRQHGIATNPRNFMIWYDYCSGINPALTRTVDVLISNGKDITTQNCSDIYDQFYTFDEEGFVVRETSSRLQANLNQVLEIVGSAGDEATRYGDALENFSGKVNAGAGGEELARLVSDMLQDTKMMEEQNKLLREQLSSSAQEVSCLKTDLEGVRHEAMTDGLTGLANRKCFDDRLREWATESMETGNQLCLVLGDIDHFKIFNDTWGHQVGDQVLKLVSRAMTDNVKGQDVVARYGGEEFAIILPNTALKQATIVANNVREKVSAKNLRRKKTGEDYGRITMSLGVAGFEPGEPLDNLIERADKALYAAKNQGRNRVVTENNGLVTAFADDTSQPRVAAVAS